MSVVSSRGNSKTRSKEPTRRGRCLSPLYNDDELLVGLVEAESLYGVTGKDELYPLDSKTTLLSPYDTSAGGSSHVFKQRCLPLRFIHRILLTNDRQIYFPAKNPHIYDLIGVTTAPWTRSFWRLTAQSKSSVYLNKQNFINYLNFLPSEIF